MTVKNEINTTTKLGKKLFLVAYFILLIKFLIGSSTLSAYLPMDGVVGKYVFRFVAYLILLVKVLSQDRYDKRTLLIYFGFFLIIVAVILSSSNSSILDLAVVLVGAHGVKLKDIVRFFFYTAATVTVVLLLLSLSGLILNYVTYKDDGTPRYAFGNIYATDFAAMIFYLQISYAYVRKTKYNILSFIFWCIVGFAIWHFCGARLDTVLIIAFNFAMALYTLFPKFFSYNVIKYLMAFSILILCILAIFLHAAYSPDSKFFTELNELLSGRLGLGKQGIDKYGFSLFGKPIKMQGWGFSNTEFDYELGYFFIDCGFLNIALCNGLAYLIILIACYIFVAVKSAKSGNCLLPLIIFFVAVSSVVDHHINQIAYNPFMFVMAVAMQNLFNVKKVKLKPIKSQITI